MVVLSILCLPPINEGGRFGLRIAISGIRFVPETTNYSHIETNTTVPFICTQVGASMFIIKSNGRWYEIQVKRLTLAEFFMHLINIVIWE
jgi:hypothetical protein